MNLNSLKLSAATTVFILLAMMGCAKKQKPDVNNDLTGMATFQDKDIAVDATGSDSGKIAGLYTVHFEYDKSSLSEEMRNLLVKDAEWLKQHTNKSMQVEGHCDRHGSTEYNLALGQRRADTVKHYLVNLGIIQNRLLTISYGKEQMLDSAETDEADVKNRRANFKLIDSPKLNLTNK